MRYRKIWCDTKFYFPGLLKNTYMEPGDGRELSVQKVRYLKFIAEKGGRVRTTDLAGEFRVDPSTVTKTVAELAKTGLLSHEPYHGICLTDDGQRYARYLIKRHRILSLMLTHYGFSHEQACQEVRQFENYVSKEAVDRICAAMGHPGQGVCGEITHDDGCLNREPAG